MQFNCPCCARSLNVYPKPLVIFGKLTQNFINDALEEKLLDNGYTEDSENATYMIQEEFECDGEVPLPEVDAAPFDITCTCGAYFSLRQSITLDEVKIPTQPNKYWISEKVKEALLIYNATPNTQYSTPNGNGNIGYHGLSAKGCVHNYKLQRRDYNGNPIVKCTHCGAEKTM